MHGDQAEQLECQNRTEFGGWNKTTERRNHSFLDPEILGTTVSPSAKGGICTTNQNSSR